ncbi:hypothetical protein [Finch poxvirus]|uniref:Uncharacterized protein n=1 Tax=Condorpox virus TaxID=3049970 RepID=A0AAT9URY7_9POXV|nr:hypothetical protein [Finch poxvirus]UOX38789.1 hypothetical protein [Finch poxvirus]UOX38941.1 hypothetical protein [Finch poxvirus]UOX39124.1 hypothetical protein [Finch poxvirus]
MDKIPLIEKQNNSCNMRIDTVRKISIASMCVSLFLIGIIAGYIGGFYTIVSFNSNFTHGKIGYYSWFCHDGACYKEVLMLPSNYSHSKYVCENLMNGKLPTTSDIPIMKLFSPIKDLDMFWLETPKDSEECLCVPKGDYVKYSKGLCNATISTVCVIR